MNDIQKQLLHLIETHSTTDNPEILHEARFQSVLAMVNHSTPLAYKIIANNESNHYAHRQIHKLLKENNIDYVVLKGVASASYYPEPIYRTMGDVDILVHECDIDQVGNLLIKNGFTEKKGSRNIHASYYKNQTVVELHWKVNGIPDGNDAAHEMLSNIIECAHEKDGVMLPTAFHHGLVILLHMAEHLVNTGIGLRHLYDWAMFESSFSGKEFENTFKEPLQKIGLWEFANILTKICIKYLGISDSGWTHKNIDESIVDSLTDDILSSGNFGRKDMQRINQAKLMSSDSQIKNHALFSLMTKKVRQEWHIADKMPFLIPIGWIYISLRHFVRILNGKRPKINLNETINGANQRKIIYRQLKLFEKDNL